MKNLAHYAETSLIAVIQELYARDLDISTNVFDDTGTINLVEPTNVTYLCQHVVRSDPVGVASCKESDRAGAKLLRAILEGAENVELPGLCINCIRQLPAEFPTQSERAIPVGVAYHCKYGFVDFAVPILDPEHPISVGHLIQEIIKPAIISIAFGGQYLMPRTAHGITASQIAERLGRELKHCRDISTTLIQCLLSNSREVHWDHLQLVSHVMFALTNALAITAKQHFDYRKEKLPFSKANVFQVYLNAFRILAGGASGCILLFNKYTGLFDYGCKCDGFNAAQCHKDSGNTFRHLRSHIEVDKVLCYDTSNDPWFIGQEQVKQNYTFALRQSDGALLGIVNLNVLRDQPPLSALCASAMSALTRQLTTFIQTQDLLAAFDRRQKAMLNLDSIARRLDSDSVTVCSDVASALAGENVQCSIWLVDSPDLVEDHLLASEAKREHFRQERGELDNHFLTCYAINSSFPGVFERTSHFEDVRAITRVLDELLNDRQGFLSFRDLRARWPEFAQSKAFTAFVRADAIEDYHLLIVPIAARQADHGPLQLHPDTFLGIVVLYAPLTAYFTETTKQEVGTYGARLYDFLIGAPDRSRANIQASLKRLPLAPGQYFTVTTFRQLLHDYLQSALTTILTKTRCQGVSVYLRRSFPADVSDMEPLTLEATANKVPKLEDGGFTVSHSMHDKEHQTDLEPPTYSTSKYDPGQGCTGFLLEKKNEGMELFRICDLQRYTALLAGSIDSLPHWSDRYIEDPLYAKNRRRGIICVKLVDTNNRCYGVLRVSSRQDGLRFSAIDAKTFSLVAQELSQAINMFTMGFRLGYRNQCLSAISRAVKNVLAITDHPTLTGDAIMASICVPLVSRSGFNLGRVGLLTLNGRTVTCSYGLGAPTEQDNQLAKDFLEQASKDSFKEAYFANQAKQKARYLRDNLAVPYDKSMLEASRIFQAIRERTFVSVSASEGKFHLSLSPLDQAIVSATQARLGCSHSFAYVPIVTPRQTGRSPAAVLYIDSPFAADDPLTEDSLENIWRFASIIGFLWSLHQLEESTSGLLRYMAHDVAHLLRAVSQQETGKYKQIVQHAITQAHYRTSAILHVYDPSRRFVMPKPRRLNVDQALKRLVAYYRIYCKDHCPNKIRFAPLKPTGLFVHGRQAWFATVIGQLLDNAVKYGQLKDGLVSISVAATEFEKNPDGYVEVMVTDTGPGMPEDIPRDMLFEKPLRAHRLAEGLGLGLLICKKMLDAWVEGGVEEPIRYDSKLGEGTCFRVLLPRRKEA